MTAEQIQILEKETAGLTMQETLGYLADKFKGAVSFSTSFGQEDQVITHDIFSGNIPVEVFTLDTGRLFEETNEVFDRTIKKYKKQIKVYHPDADLVEQLLTKKGPFSFYESVENRKECCNLRKMEPLSRALKDVKIWVTGLRAGQSENRQSFNKFEYDAKFDLIKYNPVIDWTLEEIENYIDANAIPQNSLHKKGFVSIGCAPCTRAIEPGEDIRAGRWWWEASHKECGLHS